MPKIHVNYRQGFTKISNYIFTNDKMSLNAIGLFCYMCSRPDDWQFSETGLANQLENNGKAKVAKALGELKDKKYVKYNGDKRDELGQMAGSDYVIYQIPYNVDRASLPENAFTGDKGRGVCEGEKETNYTILSNYHLLHGLSLKAMGLLSFFLNLPDEWESFSVEYLMTRFEDKKTSITRALNELKEKHYIKDHPTRNEKGRISGKQYYIYEYPYDLDYKEEHSIKIYDAALGKTVMIETSPYPENQPTDIQSADNLTTDTQVTEKPSAEKQTHININNTKINNKNITQTRIKTSSPTDTYSERVDACPVLTKAEAEEKIKTLIKYDEIEATNKIYTEKNMRGLISDDIRDLHSIDPIPLGTIMSVMTDVYCSKAREIRVNSTDTCSKSTIIERFESLSRYQIKDMADTLIAARPLNRRAYVLSLLYNRV